MLTGTGVIIVGIILVRVGIEYNNMDHLGLKSAVPLHFLGNIKITKYFNYESRFNGDFSRDN